MYINEGANVEFIKKNKTILSKLVKILRTHTYRNDRSGYIPALYRSDIIKLANTNVRVKNSIKLVFPDIKLKTDRTTYVSLKVCADTEFVTYSKDNYVWVGIELRNITAEHYYQAYESSTDIFMSMIRDTFDYIDRKSNKEFWSEVLKGTNYTIDTVDDIRWISDTTFKEFTNSYDSMYCAILANFVRDYFIKKNMFTELDPKYFPKCDKRVNFIPIIEIDANENKAFIYTDSVPQTPRSSRVSTDFSDITGKDFINSMGSIPGVYQIKGLENEIEVK